MTGRGRRRLLPHAQPGEHEASEAEIAHHLAERVDRLVAEGWERDAAEAEALRRFGDPRRIRDEIAAARVGVGPSRSARMAVAESGAALVRDLRLAARALARRPVFTATAALTLAVAIAGNAVIFSVVHATLLRPLPFPDAERLMRVFVTMPGQAPGEVRDISWSYPKYEVFRDRQDVFEALALFRAATFTLAGELDPERVDGEIVSAGYAEMLGVQPVVGRTFSAEEDAEPGTHWVAMLGHGLWTRRYGADPAIVGRSVRLGERAYRVVGVLPEGFEGLTGGAEVWVPIMTMDLGDLTGAGSHNKHLLARLRPGVTPERAIATVRELGREVHEVHPGWGDRPEAWGAGAILMADERMDPQIRTSVLFLFGAVGFLLLIACVNVANLLLARATTREHEVAIRRSLGAGRARIVRQLLTESALIAALGGAVGLLAAHASVGIVEEIAPVAARGGIFRSSLAGLTEMGLGSIRFDGAVVLFGLVVVFASVFLFGLAPALHAVRREPTSLLRDGGRGLTTRRMRGFAGQRTLVVAQLTLTFALLTGAGLMLRSMENLLADDGGFVGEGVLALRLSLPRARYDAVRADRFFQELDTRLRALPGVEEVGRNHCLPLSRSCDGTTVHFLDAGDERGTRVGIHWATAGYFRALRVPLLRGRTFTREDRDAAGPVALVSEAAAARCCPGSDPLGGRILVHGDTARVVGVVADVQYEAPEDPPEPQIYLDADRIDRRSAFVLLRTPGAPGSLVAGLRDVVRALDPELPLIDVRTMEARVADVRSRSRFGTRLLTLFGVVALVLAAIGIYGVVAFGVEERRREIGVRVAVGAERVDVLRMVVGSGVGMAAAGIVLGVGVVWALARVLRSVLFGVQPLDPVTLAGTALLLTAVSAAASWYPARRAVTIDPSTALRGD